MALPILTRPLVTLALAFVALLAGCGQTEEQRVQAIYTQSITSIPGAQAEIVKQWRAKQISLDACINLGHQSLEERRTGAEGFAMAVLGAAKDLESAAEKGGVNEFFWFRLGTLAGAAAANSYNAGDTASARALVLAGPERWQNEAYWRLHPDHDALASLVMHANGESQAALRRLRERPDLDEQALAVMRKIEDDLRAAEAVKAKAKK